MSVGIIELLTRRERAAGLTPELDEAFGQVEDCFFRPELRANARAYVAGLLSPAERKNCWELSEYGGYTSPDALQRLLNSSVWDAEQVRDRVRSYAVAELADPDAVLVFDETGFLKKGTKSAGVARQYTGTTGQVENCQIGVFATYASRRGHAHIDRELYVHRSWFTDRAAGGGRCREARIGEEVEFRTKPQLALAMAERTIDAGVPVGWLGGDEVYGRYAALRDFAHQRHIGYVFGVPSTFRVQLRAHTKVPPGTTPVGKTPVNQIRVPAPAWQKYSAGQGAKGHRLYRWALIATADEGVHILIRRPSRGKLDPKKLAYFVCHSPRPVGLAALVRIAGMRWPVEESFQTGKNEVGLDHYQVRTYHGWYRHITLALLAAAFLAVTAARARLAGTGVAGSRQPAKAGAGTAGAHSCEKGALRLWTTPA
jgi:SRSO17 transposase